MENEFYTLNEPYTPQSTIQRMQLYDGKNATEYYLNIYSKKEGVIEEIRALQIKEGKGIVKERTLNLDEITLAEASKQMQESKISKDLVNKILQKGVVPYSGPGGA
jgi:hypothetical protein